jgi:hypothetical protein
VLCYSFTVPVLLPWVKYTFKFSTQIEGYTSVITSPYTHHGYKFVKVYKTAQPIPVPLPEKFLLRNNSWLLSAWRVER